MNFLTKRSWDDLNCAVETISRQISIRAVVEKVCILERQIIAKTLFKDAITNNRILRSIKFK
jgi:hypothetical protein